MIEADAGLKTWVRLAPGEFHVSDVYRDLGDNEPDDVDSRATVYQKRLIRTMQLEQLVSEGVLQRVGDRRGYYRPIDLDCKEMDIAGANTTPSKIFLPIGLHDYVDIFPGNIITLAGEKNAGKSAFLMNVAYDNRTTYDVHYFNSEAGASEMKKRLDKISPISAWSGVHFYERSQNFSDVIRPGKECINIIDFLECHDEFYKIGSFIRDIHDALKGAIAIIAIQKNPGTEDPIGGRRATEKSRLHLAMSPGKLKITVAKNWASEDHNPNGLVCKYKLVQGHKFIPNNSTNPWGKEE